MLEVAAYKAIRIEEERKRILDSAKNDCAKEKRMADWIRAAEVARKAIELYENFCYCLLYTSPSPRDS